MKPDRTSPTPRLYHLRASGPPVCRCQSKTPRVVRSCKRIGDMNACMLSANFQPTRRGLSVRCRCEIWECCGGHYHRVATASVNARHSSMIWRGSAGKLPTSRSTMARSGFSSFTTKGQGEDSTIILASSKHKMDCLSKCARYICVCKTKTAGEAERHNTRGRLLTTSSETI